ncbi:F-box/WD repeat-containing protein 9-like isoform X2 [Temnothorax nylanderi]|uniref:F-box/WD repeat-containing protein 9-like isoform X2 n=1 Tax=Temnothorax nylanderi TaxID=102681 RepID=UPI003A83586D
MNMLVHVFTASVAFAEPSVTFASFSSRSSENTQIRTSRETMDNENARCAHVGTKKIQLSLWNLPVEIFLHICSFLDGATLVHGLSRVCKKFYLILNEDSLWKTRINHKWADAVHSLLSPARTDKLFWKLSCIAIEKQTALWEQQNSMEKLEFCTDILVDVVLLRNVNEITYIVGASDDNLIYSKLLSHEEVPFYKNKNSSSHSILAHNSAIRDLTAIDNTIYSCSFDETVKSWELTNTGFRWLNTYNFQRKDRLDSSLWCMSSCPERNLFATGSFCGTINVFDSRSGNRPNVTYRPHSVIVTKLAMNTEHILSVGKDNTMSVWDQRAGRIMKSITFPGEGVPMSVSMRRDWVFIGDSRGKLHLVNPNDFEVVKSYSTEHTNSITGVRLTHGCLITSSMDRTVRIWSPTDPPKPIATLRTEFGIFSMDYLNDTLAVSGCNKIVVWRPK